ncbi:MAG TPA: D-amino-acid transaminase [Alphaproteobacteria bacterium]|nr:D-amino-acid transaminase [Alphaproteobacteria bacterium]
MPRIAYVNGQYIEHRRAGVHIDDRGYQFADGVYEVVTIAGGRLIDADLHWKRLERSLKELRIAEPMSRAALEHVMREVIRRNGVKDGIVYAQITRGVAPRDHVFPKKARPAVVVTAKRLKAADPKLVARGVDVISLPDIRWARCDIKSLSLLPNVMAKQAAKEQGAHEAWLVDADGDVTEGSSTNAWIVSAKGALVTRPAGPEILNGVTRLAVLALARAQKMKIEERAFSLKEARKAKEAFITSSTNFVMPVTRLDGKAIGSGKPGPFAQKLREHYLAHMAKA